MPVVDFILDALGVIENLFSASIVALITYMIMGGWKYVLRAVSFFLDTQLVKLIGTVYSYFDTLLNGTMFEKAVVDELMRNVYVFVGVIMFFRLMMIVIKYLVNPDLISDAKVGANALIQRVILGVCGILFIPTIFDFMLDFQSAVLKDNLIQQIIIPKDMLQRMQEKVDKGGNYIGTYVLAGFLSPNTNASTKDINEFNLGVQQGDLSNIDINDGGFLTQKFKYDYFFLISTVALGYVFYYMLKYCIDIASRCFKLLLYQLLSPIAMVEYMINGSQDGVFKNWLTATISTYVLLFVRILAIWFVLFVMGLMSGDGNAAYAGNLLTNDDYFLRAIIIIALLGFMMDLPKLIGQIFGLDLEQEGSASGVLKQVGSMAKGAAMGGLAVGGAAAGGLIGSASAMSNARKSGLAEAKANNPLRDANGNKLTGQARKDALKNRRAEAQANTKSNLAKLNYRGQLNSLGSGIAMAALGSNQFTSAAANQFNSSKKAQEQVGESMYAQEQSKKKQKDLEAQRHQEIVGNQKLQAALELAAILDQSGIKVTPQNLVARMYPEMQSTSNASVETSAKVGGVINAAAAKMEPVDIDSNGHISNTEKRQKVVQEVEQVITAQCASSGIDVPQTTIRAQAEAIVDTSTFSMSGGNMTATVTANVAGGMEALACQDQVVTQTVNQVAGIRMNGAIEDATQVINQTLGKVVDNTAATATATTQQVDIQRNINDNLTQSVDIQRNISDNVSHSVDIQEDIQYDVHAQTDIQRNQVKMVDDIRENTIPRRSDREIPDHLDDGNDWDA